MIRRILLLSLLACPFFMTAQQKKSTKKLEEQVRKAKEDAAANEKQQPTKPAATPGAKLPPFQFVTHEGPRMTNQNLVPDQPLLLVLFNPMCDHCQKVAIEVKENIAKFKNMNILFVCGMNPAVEIPNFIQSTGLENYPMIKIVASPEEFMNQIFESKGIPQIMMYNKDLILQKTFYESIDVDKALMYLKK